MDPKMHHPGLLLPGAMAHLQAVGGVVAESGLPEATVVLVLIRASQINGCATCLDGHIQTARKNGESDQRLGTVAAWRETPFFTDAERAALAYTEALTRIADHPEPISDGLWAEVNRHYDEKVAPSAGLIVCIANINLWNRLNIGSGQVVGTWSP